MTFRRRNPHMLPWGTEQSRGRCPSEEGHLRLIFGIRMAAEFGRAFVTSHVPKMCHRACSTLRGP